MDEWLIDSLNNIEKRTKELEDSNQVLLEELKVVQELLYIVLEQMSEKEIQNDILSVNNLSLEDRNVYILHPQKNRCLEMVRQLALSSNVQCIVIDEVITPRSFAAKLNSGQEGDYVFVNYLYFVNSPELQELLMTAANDNTMRVTIGQGESARKISLNLPCLRYIVYAPSAGILSVDLMKHLRKIEI